MPRLQIFPAQHRVASSVPSGRTFFNLLQKQHPSTSRNHELPCPRPAVSVAPLILFHLSDLVITLADRSFLRRLIHKLIAADGLGVTQLDQYRLLLIIQSLLGQSLCLSLLFWRGVELSLLPAVFAGVVFRVRPHLAALAAVMIAFTAGFPVFSILCAMFFDIPPTKNFAEFPLHDALLSRSD